MNSPLKLNVGDVVHVRAVVSALRTEPLGNVRLGLPSGHYIFVDPSEIVHVAPRPLKVGDSVVDPVWLHCRPVKIVAISGDYAWTVRDGTNFQTFKLGNLRRVGSAGPKWKAGDRVIWNGGVDRGVIYFVHPYHEEVEVAFDGGNGKTVRLRYSDMEREP